MVISKYSVHVFCVAIANTKGVTGVTYRAYRILAQKILVYIVRSVYLGARGPLGRWSTRCDRWTILYLMGMTTVSFVVWSPVAIWVLSTTPVAMVSVSLTTLMRLLSTSLSTFVSEKAVIT